MSKTSETKSKTSAALPWYEEYECPLQYCGKKFEKVFHESIAQHERSKKHQQALVAQQILNLPTDESGDIICFCQKWLPSD